MLRVVSSVLLVLAFHATAMAEDAPLPAVGVTPVVLQDLTPKLRVVGRAEAIDRVELVARVTGFLDQRLVEQGQLVHEGDLLFVIEKAQYEAVLAQRQAQLASAQAEVATAAAQLARGEQLLEGQYIPEAEVDERRARLLVAEAAVLVARAAIEAAQLDLGYTDVHAPITGRIGRFSFSVGAFVGPDSGSLATIVSQDPVYVTFPISQAVLTRVRQEDIERGAQLDIVVYAELPTGERYGHPGKVEFGEVEVATGTDTLTVRATFPNPDSLLTPGQFLGVILEYGDPIQALAIPSAALLFDQVGYYVLVVGEDDVVEQRRIALDTSESKGSLAIVTDGLDEGERVIVEGIQKVRPGQKVAPSPVADADGS